jgi:hypothetical protein
MNENSLLSLKSILSLALRDIENNPSTITYWLLIMFFLGKLDESWLDVANKIIEMMLKFKR